MLRPKQLAPCLAAWLALSLLTGCAVIEEPPRQPTEPTEAFSIADIRPGDDFYGYCNAAELMELHIPENRSSVGSFADLQTRVDDQIEAMILEIADSEENFAPGSNEQLVRDLYRLAYADATGATDTAAADTQTIQDVLDAISDTQNMQELCTLWGDLVYDYGCAPVLEPVVTPDLYDPTRNALMIPQFYSIDDLQAVYEDDWSASYMRDNLKQLLAAAGVPAEETRERATNIVYAMLDIAAVTDFSDDEEQEHDPGAYWTFRTDAELAARMQNLTIDDLYTLLGYGGMEPNPTGGIALASEAQFFRIESLLDDAHLQMWQDYTACAFLQCYQYSLPETFGDIRIHQKQDPQEYAVMVVNYVLGYEIGELYAQRYFDEQKREDITALCRQIQDEYEVLISGADWLSSEGKRCLLDKLHNMPCFVGAGAPHEIVPEDAGLIGESLLDTDINNNMVIMQNTLWSLYDPVEPNGFLMMDPQTVNACYDPQSNCFTITAAILNPPFYDETADPMQNLGGIGSVIGHEISHAFDDCGMKYDATGAYRPDWMPEADRAAFAAMQEKASDYYSKFTVLDTYHVRGRKTLGENLADISGVQCVLSIAGNPADQKTVFTQYAEIWKELSLDTDAKEQLADDVHAPAPVRVNAVVACFDAFYEIYDVQEGDALYVAPADRLRRW